MSAVVCGDEVTIHVRGKVNTHNCRIWVLQDWRDSVELQRDSPKVNVSCALSNHKMYWPLFFAESTIASAVHLKMLENWLWLRLTENFPQVFIHVQPDAAPRHCRQQGRQFLLDQLQGRWIGPVPWPPRSPDLIPLDFFWADVKEHVYIPSLPTAFNGLKERTSKTSREWMNAYVLRGTNLAGVWMQAGCSPCY